MLEANSLFDENSYLTANPDVAAAKNQGLLNSGYDHFMQFGKFEGRSPSAYFDHSLYLSKNPDVCNLWVELVGRIMWCDRYKNLHITLQQKYDK